MKVLSTRFGMLFYTIICIVYWLKVIGLAPFSIHHERATKNTCTTYNWAIRFSKVGQSYNFLISILLPGISGFAFQQLSSMDYVNKSPLVETTDRLQGFIMGGTILIILTSWTIKQKKATNIMDRLVDTSARLSRMEIQPSYEKSLIFSFVHVLVISFLWIILWATTCLLFTFNESLIAIFAVLPIIAICLYIIEYYTVVGLVAVQLESVNKNLLNFKTVKNYSSSNQLLNTYLDAFSLPIHGQLAILRSLQNIRATLFEISRDIANFFSFPILACCAYFFFIFVCNIYYSITPIVTSNGVSSPNLFFVATAWVAISVYPITTLLSNVIKTVNKAKSTARIIHKLLAVSIKPRIQAELQQFSLQLLHEDFNFTAYGFFTLDFTLLHTILGSTATYIVIFIQFQQLQFKLHP